MINPIMETAFSSVMALALTLSPFGKLADLLERENPWRGSSSGAAMIWVARAEVQKLGPTETCAERIERLRENLPVRQNMDRLVELWAPWTEDADATLRGCDSYPCRVKLNQAETHTINSAPASRRKDVFISLVRDRVRNYRDRGELKEYESSDGQAETLPVNPWDFLWKTHFLSPFKIPTTPLLSTRILDFHDSRLQPIRQVIDSRFQSARDPDGILTATVWTRAAYSDHYFDSWGEWTRVDCSLGERDVAYIQAVVIELDLLKKNDLLSILARPIMRSHVSEAGRRYLDEQFRKITGGR